MINRNPTFRQGQTGATKSFLLETVDDAGVATPADLTDATVIFRLESQKDQSRYAYTTVDLSETPEDGVVTYTQGVNDLPASKSPFLGYFEVTQGSVINDFPEARDLLVRSLPNYIAEA